MRKSIRPPRVAFRVIEVWVFLSSKTSPANVTTLSSALAGILSYKIIASLLLEQVVDGSNKYNRGLGDYFYLCSPILGSSSGPFQLIVRCRDDDSFGFRAEKKRACPVLLEPNPLPMDHSPALICSWKNLPCGICVPSNSTVFVSKRTSLDSLRLHDCGLAMHECQ